MKAQQPSSSQPLLRAAWRHAPSRTVLLALAASTMLLCVVLSRSQAGVESRMDASVSEMGQQMRGRVAQLGKKLAATQAAVGKMDKAVRGLLGDLRVQYSEQLGLVRRQLAEAKFVEPVRLSVERIVDQLSQRLESVDRSVSQVVRRQQEMSEVVRQQQDDVMKSVEHVAEVQREQHEAAVEAMRRAEASSADAVTNTASLLAQVNRLTHVVSQLKNAQDFQQAQFDAFMANRQGGESEGNAVQQEPPAQSAPRQQRQQDQQQTGASSGREPASADYDNDDADTQTTDNQEQAHQPEQEPEQEQEQEQEEQEEQEDEALTATTNEEEEEEEEEAREKRIYVVWDFGAGGCTGWAMEAINYVVPLSQRSEFEVGIVAGDDYCTGLSSSVTSVLDELRAKPMGEWDIDVFVSHKPPSRYPRFPYNGLVTINKRPKVVIGRSMTEVDRLHWGWAERCQSMVDEVWVPATFLSDMFVKAGVDADRVRVVPESIDTSLYDRDAVSPVPLQGRRGFNFFSVFKWEPRKGVDVLLKAYFQEFTPDDDVSLFLQTYLYGEFDPRNFNRIQKRVMSFAREVNKTVDEVPTVNIISDLVSTAYMPRLYKTMDAFVLPTRGEGWGLPIMEAMTMGLPVIATAWSGHTEFCDARNSYLVPLDGMVPAVGREWEYGQQWANPSISKLREIMRFVFNNQQEARAVGERARSDMINKYNLETIADFVAGELKGALQRKQQREQTQQQRQQEQAAASRSGDGQQQQEPDDDHQAQQPGDGDNDNNGNDNNDQDEQEELQDANAIYNTNDDNDDQNVDDNHNDAGSVEKPMDLMTLLKQRLAEQENHHQQQQRQQQGNDDLQPNDDNSASDEDNNGAATTTTTANTPLVHVELQRNNNNDDNKDSDDDVTDPQF